MKAEISWTPIIGAINQKVEYKLHSDINWTVFSTVSSSVNSATITGLLEDNVYDFRIVTVCSSTENPSDVVTTTTIRCILYSTVSGDTSIEIDIYGNEKFTSYQLNLYKDGNQIATHTITGSFVNGTNYPYTFTGLDDNTSYTWKVIPFINEFSKTDCNGAIIHIPPVPCNAPTLTSASIDISDPIAYYSGARSVNGLDEASIENFNNFSYNMHPGDSSIVLHFNIFVPTSTTYSFWIAEHKTEPLKTVWSTTSPVLSGNIQDSSLFDAVTIIGNYRVYSSSNAQYHTLGITSPITLSVS